MTALDLIIDSPIGALFFVSATISLFALLSILILRKGTETHNVLGYLYFFGIGFANYASAMAYYQGLLPVSAVIISVPISTPFLILGIVFIMPQEKSAFRIKGHILSMIIATIAFTSGIMTQWYHFKVALLDVFNWANFQSVLLLFLPLLGIGFLTALHYLSEAENLSMKYIGKPAAIVKQDTKNVEIEIITPPRIRSSHDSDIIYQDENTEEQTKLNQRGQDNSLPRA